MDDCKTPAECIEVDLEWIKKELSALTKHERRLILDEYDEFSKMYGVGLKEYSMIVNAFNDLEDK